MAAGEIMRCQPRDKLCLLGPWSVEC